MLARLAGCSVLLSLLSVLPCPVARADNAWEELRFEDGVRVWQRDVDGSSFVEFKGNGRIDASIQMVLAVLHDQDRKVEWLASCRENRLVRAKALGQNVIYNRIKSNFPLVADRDVVVETRLAHNEERREVRIDVWSIEDKLAPPTDEAVRMPKLELSWTLVAVDDRTTEVTYQVAADPGGMLPAWVVNAVSKEIPFRTISNLRSQVKKSGYEKNLAVVESAFDWEGAATRARERAGTGG